MLLTASSSNDYTPHPAGVFPAVCVDVQDVGQEVSTFAGKTRLVNRIRLVFETSAKMPDGKPMTIARKFTASLNPKSNFAEFIGKWRGKPIESGEQFETEKLVNKPATLIIASVNGQNGQTYSNIDSVSVPTQPLAPSGNYNRQEALARYLKYRNATTVPVQTPVAAQPATAQTAPAQPASVPAPTPQPAPQPPSATPAYKPDLGF